MSTARDIISASRRVLNIDEVGANVSSEEMFEGLTLLNQMLDNWSNQRLAIYYIQDELFPLEANVATYTIGLSDRVIQGNSGTWTGGYVDVTINGVDLTQSWVTSTPLTMAALANKIKATQYNNGVSNATYDGTLDALTITNNGSGALIITVDLYSTGLDTQTYTLTPLALNHIETNRPLKILRTFVRLTVSGTDPIDYPIEMLTSEQYQLIARKNLKTNYPQFAYYQPMYPFGNITFYPIPVIELTLGLSQTTQFKDCYSLTAPIILPTGYERALIYNLALEMAPRYGRDDKIGIGSPIWTQAKESLADIKRTNHTNPIMRIDGMLIQNTGMYNIYTDGYNAQINA